MMKKTNALKRMLVLLLVISFFLLSIGYARENIKDTWASLFDDRSIAALEKYQNKYTPLEALQLKLEGKLPKTQLQIREEKPLLPAEDLKTLEQQPLDVLVDADCGSGESVCNTN